MIFVRKYVGSSALLKKHCSERMHDFVGSNVGNQMLSDYILDLVDTVEFGASIGVTPFL